MDRTKYIGGSDAGTIMGVNPFESIIDAWERKINPVHFEPNPDMRRGLFMESFIVDRIREEIDPTINTLESTQPWELHDGQAYVIKKINGVPCGGHVDGMGKDSLYEIKAPKMATLARWRSNGIPKYYVAQMQHYMMVSGYKQCQFIALDYDKWKLIPVTFYADPEMHQLMKIAYRKFWDSVRSVSRPEENRFEFDSVPPEAMGILEENARIIQTTKERMKEDKDAYDDARLVILSYLDPGSVVATETCTIDIQQRGDKNFVFVRDS